MSDLCVLMMVYRGLNIVSKLAKLDNRELPNIYLARPHGLNKLKMKGEVYFNGANIEEYSRNGCHPLPCYLR